MSSCRSPKKEPIASHNRLIYGDKYERKLEEFGCNYPIPHPGYCNCDSCKKYKQWLKREKRKQELFGDLA